MNFFRKRIQFFNSKKNKESLFSAISFFFFILGVTGVWGLTEYSGEKPVNIFFFLLVSLIIPLIFFLANLITFFVSSKKKSISLVLKRAFRYFGGVEENLTEVFIQKQIVLNGIYYSLGAILVILLKVSFSDILFGWASSLNLSSQNIHSLIQVIASPWEWLLPEASPNLYIVKISEYFRTDKSFLLEHRSIDELKMIATWWKFLIMAIITYGVIPRLLYGGYLLLQKQPTSIIKNKKSIFEFHHGSLSSLFELNKQELYFYNSFLALLIENDIELEKDLMKKNSKKTWFKKWEKLLLSEGRMSKEEIVSSLNHEKNNNKLLILLCEMTSFSAYYELEENEEESLKFNQSESVLFIQRHASLAFESFSHITNYFEKFSFNLKQSSSHNLKAWIGLAFLSAGAIALTGGLGIGVGVALAKILGVATVSAKATGIALLGSGIFLLGGENQKVRLFVGCGALFHALEDNTEFSKQYFNSTDSVKKDLVKLATFRQFNFFSDDFVNFNQDFDFLLQSVASQSSSLKSIVNKIEEKILKS